MDPQILQAQIDVANAQMALIAPQKTLNDAMTILSQLRGAAQLTILQANLSKAKSASSQLAQPAS